MIILVFENILSTKIIAIPSLSSRDSYRLDISALDR
jgi:hypothetical protein